ncbi:MAG: DegT/DnrJ/EryC1/StrS family aminotransferase [Terriglobales bacterium]
MKNSNSTILNNSTAPVPLLDLRRQYDGLRDEVLAAIARVCDSQGFILGPEVEALEREISALTGAAAAVGCASGTEALWLALVAAGVRPGDAVITTAFSFFASASAIVRAGATPILMDVDPGTLNLDPRLVEERLRAEFKRKGSASAGLQGSPAESEAENKIRLAGQGEKQTQRQSHEPRTIRAILPVHLYGQCADMDWFDRIAQEFGIAIVEDAAQAIGAGWRGRGAGSLGATAAFSFYPTKNLSAYGDAGIVTTTNIEMAEHMRRLRNHGSPRRYYHDEFGWNGRMDAIQAAVLRVKLPHVGEWNEARRRNAATYDRLFAESGLTRSVTSPTSSSARSDSAKSAGASATPVRLLARAPEATHVFHQYVIRAERRDDLRQFLAARKIGTEIYYPLPLHLQPVFSYLGLKEGDLPVAEQAAKEVLALPMFPELTESEIRCVVENIAEFYS